MSETKDSLVLDLHRSNFPSRNFSSRSLPTNLLHIYGPLFLLSLEILFDTTRQEHKNISQKTLGTHLFLRVAHDFWGSYPVIVTVITQCSNCPHTQLVGGNPPPSSIGRALLVGGSTAPHPGSFGIASDLRLGWGTGAQGSKVSCNTVLYSRVHKGCEG